MTVQLKIPDPQKAKQYFEDKVAFTVGPFDINYLFEQGEKPLVIDVRSREDFEKGHIPGAFNLPEDSWVTLEGLAKDQSNVLCCYSQQCHLAARAAIYFASKGFPVIEMEGGMQAWRDYGYGEESGASKEKKAAA